MNFDLSQHWIDTFSDYDWENVSLRDYWQQLYNLQNDEVLLNDGKWNTRLLEKHHINQRDLECSLMYFTNTVSGPNPRPAIWGLQQMKIVFPKLFASEFSICFEMVSANHPSAFSQFIKIGGGGNELDAFLDKIKLHNTWHLLPDVLRHFVPKDGDYGCYKKLGILRKTLYKSIGFEDAKLSDDQQLKIDWMFTKHIQKAMGETDVFEQIWEKIVYMYPHPHVVDAIEKYVASPHHCATFNVPLLLAILNTPLEKQNFDLMRALVDNEVFFTEALDVCLEREWSFNDDNVVGKFLSFASEQAIEQTFEKICQKENSNRFSSRLNEAERLCEWVDAQLHAKITEIALLSVCKKHPHLYNNLQKMTLLSELHTESKPKSRKM